MSLTEAPSELDAAAQEKTLDFALTLVTSLSEPNNVNADRANQSEAKVVTAEEAEATARTCAAVGKYLLVNRVIDHLNELFVYR